MLKGTLVTLRQPLEEDLDLLTSIRNNVELQTMLMTLPRANTSQRVKNWLTNHLNNPQTIFFIIAENLTNQSCGYIQLVNMDFIHGFGELGICLDTSKQGKGYGKDAIKVLERYIQDTFNLRKIILKVILDNLSAISLYENLGYSKVGIYKKHFYNQGKFSDVMLMEKILFLNKKDRL